MALGKPNAFNGQTYSVKLKMKDGEQFLDCAVFDVQQKVGDEYKTLQRVKDVSGHLVDVKAERKVVDDNVFKTGTLELHDKNERYFVQFSLGSGLGRGLANSVLNLSVFNDVRIGLYSQKDREDPKKVYPAVALRNGAAKETVKWKYDPKEGEIPPAREYEGKDGKVERDWTKTENFLIAELNEFGKIVRDAAANAPKQEEPASEPSNSQDDQQEYSAPASESTPRGTTKLTQAVEEDDSSIPF